MSVQQESIYLALGANLASPVGGPADTLRAALDQLSEKGAAIRAVSPFYSTPAYPAGNGPDFVNAAARISASWSAEETLAILHDIEADLGRTRNTRWGQRTLDLDLIAYGDAVLPDPQTHAYWRNLPPDEQNRIAPQELVLPHPRLQDRAFVLVPLADVASDWVHPLLGQSVRALCAALDPADVEAVRRLQ